MKKALLLAAACVGIMSCAGSSGAPATAADAKTFLDTINDTMKRLGIEHGRAGWVQQTFITDDTEAIAARANQLAIDAAARFAKEAVKFDKADVPAYQRARSTATSCRPRDQPTCSGTSGRRTGPTATRALRRRAPTPATRLSDVGDFGLSRFLEENRTNRWAVSGRGRPFRAQSVKFLSRVLGGVFGRTA